MTSLVIIDLQPERKLGDMQPGCNRVTTGESREHNRRSCSALRENEPRGKWKKFLIYRQWASECFEEVSGIIKGGNNNDNNLGL